MIQEGPEKSGAIGGMTALIERSISIVLTWLGTSKCHYLPTQLQPSYMREEKFSGPSEGKPVNSSEARKLDLMGLRFPPAKMFC